MALGSIPRRSGNSSATPNPRRYLSFFSGALGLDLGFEQAGYECLSLNEIDPVASETIRLNLERVFPKPPNLYSRDIRDLTAVQLRTDLGPAADDLFAIIGGPPCQAFSTAGKRLGLNDERGNVFMHFIDLIGQLQPKYAVFENVRGLLSAPLEHRPHSERGPGCPPLTVDELPKGALKQILAKLKGYGYTTTFNLYNTANFGVPQVRERLIFFASRDGREVPFLSATHDEHGRNGLPRWKSLRAAIGGIQQQDHDSASFPERRLKYYRLLKAGQNWRCLPPDMQKEAMGLSWYSGGGKTGFFRRLSWDRPSPTLVTSPTMPATDLCHPEELRPLSVEEYAAIQTYPTWFKFSGKVTDKYRQIGNAVPVNFGAAVARHLACFDERQVVTPATASIRPSRYVGTDHASWLGEAYQTDLQLQLV